MTPPTPSKRSVAPISSGATSCTERAKKSRLSCMPLCVVPKESREQSSRYERAGDAEDPARGDREANARGVGDDPGFEVADGWRACDLHELDSADPAEEPVGREREEHRVPEDRADLVGKAGDAEENEREPELAGVRERGDGHSPQARGRDDDESLPPDAGHPAGAEP